MSLTLGLGGSLVNRSWKCHLHSLTSVPGPVLSTCPRSPHSRLTSAPGSEGSAMFMSTGQMRRQRTILPSVTQLTPGRDRIQIQGVCLCPVGGWASSTSGWFGVTGVWVWGCVMVESSPLGLAVHQVIWRAGKPRLGPREGWLTTPSVHPAPPATGQGQGRDLGAEAEVLPPARQGYTCSLPLPELLTDPACCRVKA